MSDFYDSEMETDAAPRRYDLSSRDTTLERPASRTATSRPPAASPSATNYLLYRSRNILDRGPYHWPTSAPATLDRAAGRSQRGPDLFDVARRRRAGDTTDRLEDWINSLLTTTSTLRAQSASPLRSQQTNTSTTQPRVVSSKYPRSVDRRRI